MANNSNDELNMSIQDGDHIFVAMKPDITQILGEVSSPGIYKFIPGKRMNDYIAMAGGFSMDAEKKDIWITFPDGKSQQYKRWLSNPRVMDGSVISVGLKKEMEPFDVTEYAKEVTTILTNLAQMVVVIIIASQ